MTDEPILSVLHFAHIRGRERPDICRQHALIVALLGLDEGAPKTRELWAHPRPDRLLIQWPTPLRPSGMTATHLPVRTRWEEGDRVRWAATINPVKAAFVRGQRGRRTLVDPALWAVQRLTMLDHHDLQVVDERTVTGMHSSGRRVTHRQARLTGTATVLHADALHDAIVDGVGHGKAYGSGLLLVEES